MSAPATSRNQNEADGLESREQDIEAWERAVFSHESILQRNMEYLFPQKELDELDEPLKSDLERIRSMYGEADTLAVWFQGSSFRALTEILVLVFLAAVSFELFDEISPLFPACLGWVKQNPWVFFLPFLMVWVIAFIIHNGMKKTNCQAKHQSYRALTEGLRVQFFWRLAGLEKSVDQYYKPKASEKPPVVLDTIRILKKKLRGEMLAVESGLQYGAGAAKAFELILKRWVEDQRLYFERASRSEGAKMRKCEGTAKICFFCLALGLAVIWFFLNLALLIKNGMGSQEPFQDPNHWTTNILKVLMSLGLVATGLHHHYVEKKGFAEHVEKYKDMSDLFAGAGKALRASIDASNFKEARNIIQRLGEDALGENAEWVRLHRLRPLEVPQG
jgi:hypothetical protein